MSNVVCINLEQATPQQVLAQAYSQAQAGQIRDVVLIATRPDGEMEFAMANCTPADLAVAALYLAAEARKALKIEG